MKQKLLNVLFLLCLTLFCIKNSCVWKLSSVQGEKEIYVQETEDSQGEASDSGWTEYFVLKRSIWNGTA